MLDSIIKYGNAEYDTPIGWEASTVTVKVDNFNNIRYFSLPASVVFQQDVPKPLFSDPSVSYEFKASYFREKSKDILNLDIDAYAMLIFTYENDIVDTYTFPMQAKASVWTDIDITYSIRTDITLIGISANFTTVNAIGGFRLNEVKLLPSETKARRTTDTNTQNGYNNEPILYGLSTNMPVLR
jgi:hypothetical protein